MATSSSEVSLKCSVCLELYTDPRALPCLHTFCLHCLEQLVKDTKCSTIICPKCRAENEVPGEGVASYPVDVTLLPELERTRQEEEARQQEEEICGCCTSGDVAVGYCTDCGEYLCEWCRDTVHKRSKLFLSHTLISLDDDGPVLPSPTGQEHCYCHSHAGYKLEVYCWSCNIIVCSMCMLEHGHREHEFEFIKNMRDELMDKIKGSTENIVAKEKKLKLKLSSIETLESVINSRRTQLESKITTAFDECVSILQERKRKLLSEVEYDYTRNSKVIWGIKNDLEALLLKVDSCKSFSLRYQKQGHLLSLTNQLLNCLDKIEGTNVDVVQLLSDSVVSRMTFSEPHLSYECLGTLSKKKDLSVKGTLATENGTKLQSYDTITCDLRETVRMHYTLEEHIAYLFEWTCSFPPYTSVSVSTISSNEVLLEVTPKKIGRYRLNLKANDHEIFSFNCKSK